MQLKSHVHLYEAETESEEPSMNLPSAALSYVNRFCFGSHHDVKLSCSSLLIVTVVTSFCADNRKLPFSPLARTNY